MTQDMIRTILDQMDELNEKLMSLPDDMLLKIDPRDNHSVTRGSEFLTQYNNSLEDFSKNLLNIKKIISQHFYMNPEEEEIEKVSENRESKDRIIKELDQTIPHYLNEDFTYKRPYGFIIHDYAEKGLKTWKSLYLNILSFLKQRDEQKFYQLTENEEFLSNRENPYFSRDKKRLRVPEKFEENFFVEVNLSAKFINQNIKKLLEYFDINPSDMKIFLREDRDAVL